MKKHPVDVSIAKRRRKTVVKTTKGAKDTILRRLLSHHIQNTQNTPNTPIKWL